MNLSEILEARKLWNSICRSLREKDSSSAKIPFNCQDDRKIFVNVHIPHDKANILLLAYYLSATVLSTPPATELNDDCECSKNITKKIIITMEIYSSIQKLWRWASLVAQWLRICLLMQGTRVRALVWEDPTCHGAAGPVCHNC